MRKVLSIAGWSVLAAGFMVLVAGAGFCSIVANAAGGARRRGKWDNATARARLLNGTMSEAEKRFRGHYPYHGGPFS